MALIIHEIFYSLNFVMLMVTLYVCVYIKCVRCVCNPLCECGQGCAITCL